MRRVILTVRESLCGGHSRKYFMRYLNVRLEHVFFRSGLTDVSFSTEFSVRDMKILIAVEAKNLAALMIAIKATTDAGLAEVQEVELDANEYHELMQKIFISNKEDAMRGAISGGIVFLDVPIKRK